MEFLDRELKCSDCGTEFVFTAGEQLFFHDKQFTNAPKHCKRCKAKRNSSSRKSSVRNRGNVRSVWLGDNRSLQAKAGQTSALSSMFSESGVTVAFGYGEA